MYDKHLDAFIAVVDYGSFSKAAEELFISSTALTKHVNLLERDLGIKLLERTNRGVVVTEAGALIYRKAKDLIAKSNAIVQSARDIEASQVVSVRIATSQMRTAKRITDVWREVGYQYPNINISLVSITDEASVFNNKIWDIGASFDILVGVHPSSTWEWFDMVEVVDVYTSWPIVMAPLGHPLNGRRHVKLDDLRRGEVLWVPNGGVAPSVDYYRKRIEEDFPQIKMKSYCPYDMESLNVIAAHGELALAHDDYIGLHPAFSYVSLDDEPGFPIALTFSRNANEVVKTFVEAVRKMGDAR